MSRIVSCDVMSKRGVSSVVMVAIVRTVVMGHSKSRLVRIDVSCLGSSSNHDDNQGSEKLHDELSCCS
ncbi:hypothetical protein HBI98_23180, partial [Aeromonas veronii]|nr:hypothetical protein [Aeromonas veronii]